MEVSDGDVKVRDGTSRWGIKGLSEISDGLSAVYRFEQKINSAKANQSGGSADGRLSFVGLSGGFGTITVGQIWSASFNSVGAITDNSFAYGDSGTSYRVGNAVSYAVSTGSVSLQVDAIMDGSKESEDVDQLQFGLSVGLGDVGKIALAHINVEDNEVETSYRYTTSFAVAATDSAAAKSAVVYDLLSKPIKATLDKTSESFGFAGGNAESPRPIPPGDAPICGSSLVGTKKTTCVDHVAYYYIDDDNGDHIIVDITDDALEGKLVSAPKSDGYETNAIAFESALGGITSYLGWSEKEMNDKSSETTMIHAGVRGAIGDTGMSWNLMARDVEVEYSDKTKTKAEYTPWLVGLSKSLGGGASLIFEHGDPDGENEKKDSLTSLHLKVDF